MGSFNQTQARKSTAELAAGRGLPLPLPAPDLRPRSPIEDISVARAVAIWARQLSLAFTPVPALKPVDIDQVLAHSRDVALLLVPFVPLIMDSERSST